MTLRFIPLAASFVWLMLLSTHAFGLTQDELTRQQAAWQATGWNEYQFVFQRYCFCIGDFAREAQLHVVNGTVIDATDTQTLQPLKPTDFLSIEQIFDQLQDAIDTSAARIDTTFDRQFGYPSQVYIDRSFMIADEELSYRATSATNRLSPIACDIDQTRTCAGPLIDAASRAANEVFFDPYFDFDNDFDVDRADVNRLIERRLKTYYGDSNLDGLFNSSDFVSVFQAGQFEDAIEDNSRWATGDWNGDREFNSSDFVLAFEKGGYDVGPRAATAAVPEGGLTAGAMAGLLGVIASRRRKKRWAPYASTSGTMGCQILNGVG